MVDDTKSMDGLALSVQNNPHYWIIYEIFMQILSHNQVSWSFEPETIAIWHIINDIRAFFKYNQNA